MLTPASAKLVWSHCCRSVCAECCAVHENTSGLADRRSVDAEAEPRGIGLVAQSSESGCVAADEEWHGMGRVAQSAEEVVASLGLVESAAGKRSPVQPCIEA